MLFFICLLDLKKKKKKSGKQYPDGFCCTDTRMISSLQVEKTGSVHAN